VIAGSPNGAGITIDVLDVEPPRAGDGWRNLAGGFLGISEGPDPSEQRTPFGTVSLETTDENLRLTMFVGTAPSHPSREFFGLWTRVFALKQMQIHIIARDPINHQY
jgi:hypothetical protein